VHDLGRVVAIAEFVPQIGSGLFWVFDDPGALRERV
jgi:hypothetical protein